MELSPVPLAPLFETVRTEDIELARLKGLDLRILSTQAVVMSNALLLDAIVQNLVRNAIQYTPALGRVLLACRSRGDEVRIDIYDTGIGVSAHQLPQMFQAFQRLDSTKPDGLGLGLFIVRRAIQTPGSSHRGQLHGQPRIAIFSAGQGRHARRTDHEHHRRGLGSSMRMLRKTARRRRRTLKLGHASRAKARRPFVAANAASINNSLSFASDISMPSNWIGMSALGTVKAIKYRRFSASNPAERGGNS